MTHALTPFIPVCDAIATLFAPHVEAVLHDLDTGLIFHLSNAFSRRRPGDGSLNEAGFVENLTDDVIGPYAKSNWNGHRLKAITAVLRDADGKAIGLLCINHDIDALSGAFEQLRSMMEMATPQATTPGLVSADWREAVNAIIGDFLASRRTTIAGLTAQDMDDLFAVFDARGIFAIRKAVPYVAELLNLSRTTIYNRIGAQRRRQDAPTGGNKR